MDKKKDPGKKRLELKLLLLTVLYFFSFLMNYFLRDSLQIIFSIISIDIVFTIVFTNWLFYKKIKKIDSKTQEIGLGVSFIWSLVVLFIINGLLMISPYVVLGLI